MNIAETQAILQRCTSILHVRQRYCTHASQYCRSASQYCTSANDIAVAPTILQSCILILHVRYSILQLRRRHCRAADDIASRCVILHNRQADFVQSYLSIFSYSEVISFKFLLRQMPFANRTGFRRRTERFSCMNRRRSGFVRWRCLADRC